MGRLSAALAASVPTATGLLAPFEATGIDARCVGPAVTAAGPAGDNLVLYRALQAARPGDVLVVALGPPAVAGHWGDLLTAAAVRAGVAGLVIDGSIRDLAEIARSGFPVFHRGRSPRQAVKRDPGRVNQPIDLDGTTVSPGDVIVADADGVVVVPAADADRVAAEAEVLLAREREIERRLRAGTAIGEAFGVELGTISSAPAGALPADAGETSG